MQVRMIHIDRNPRRRYALSFIVHHGSKLEVSSRFETVLRRFECARFVQKRHVRGRKENELFLSANDAVKIFVVVFVERRSTATVTYPQVHRVEGFSENVVRPFYAFRNILGEHGDTMVPIWSSATVGGLPLTEVSGCDANFQRQVFDRTKKSGAEVISRKGGAGWAVAATIAQVAHAIALDRKQLLPVSSLLEGAYGLREVCLSVPSTVGRGGVEEHVGLKLWPKEEQALRSSAGALREMLSKVSAQAGG